MRGRLALNARYKRDIGCANCLDYPARRQLLEDDFL